MARLILAAALLAVAVAPATADAKRVRTSWFQNAYVADRFFAQLGFIPINAIQAPGTASRYRAGKTTYVVTWTNALFNRPTTAALKQAARYVKSSPVNDGIYTDRFLRAKERRSYQVLIDLARDADVLVVHRDNPVCATGLTLAQARGIARGSITRWSQVAALPAGQPDVITRRLVGQQGRKGDAFAEPRFGAGIRSPHTVVDADGGVGEAAGDRSIAGVTSWSRVRRGNGACVVAIDGVAPTNAAVHGLRYPGAYPVQYVMHRKRSKAAESRVQVREYVRFMKSERASELLRNTGVLLVADPAPADSGAPSAGAPPSAGGPSRDRAGRTITPVRDDGAAGAELAGERLESGPIRYAFEAGGVLVERVQQDAESCRTSSGGWTVLEGWRYAEHGGGIIARVRLDLETSTEVTIELPGDTPSIGYIDGQPYARDAGLPAACG